MGGWGEPTVTERAVVKAPTPTSTIEISESAQGGRCLGCRVMGGGLLLVVIRPDDRPRSPHLIHVCGSCLGMALGYHLAAPEEIKEEARRVIAEKVAGEP